MAIINDRPRFMYTGFSMCAFSFGRPTNIQCVQNVNTSDNSATEANAQWQGKCNETIASERFSEGGKRSNNRTEINKITKWVIIWFSVIMNCGICKEVMEIINFRDCLSFWMQHENRVVKIPTFFLPFYHQAIGHTMNANCFHSHLKTVVKLNCLAFTCDCHWVSWSLYDSGLTKTNTEAPMRLYRNKRIRIRDN